jgi:hypothetical protein
VPLLAVMVRLFSGVERTDVQVQRMLSGGEGPGGSIEEVIQLEDHLVISSLARLSLSFVGGDHHSLDNITLFTISKKLSRKSRIRCGPLVCTAP